VTLDTKAATELYVYGYPLVYCTNEILKSTGPEATLIPGGVPFNE
jgi:hypothetical protein